jgi:hypothetical protein
VRAAAAGLAAALVAGAVAGAAPPGPGDGRSAERGAAWLARVVPMATGGGLADAIVALAASGRPPSRLGAPVARLLRIAPRYGRGSGPAGKVALAAEAAGRDPRRFGGVDYLARIRSGYAAGRFGASGFDDALSILALAGAGQPVPPAAVSALRATRGEGGWGNALRPAAPDDVSTTAIVIEALRAARVRAADPMLRDAAAWMTAQRNAEGGYAFTGAGGPTEANSTAFAIRALRALGRTPPAATRAALRRLQEPDGAFDFRADSPGSRLLATNDAVVALAGRTLPVPPAGAGTR